MTARGREEQKEDFRAIRCVDTYGTQYTAKHPEILYTRGPVKARTGQTEGGNGTEQKEYDLWECEYVLIAYRKLLKRLIAQYAPQGAEEPLSDRFLAAVSAHRRATDTLNLLLSPRWEEKQETVAELNENGTIHNIKQYLEKKGEQIWRAK